MRNKNGKLLYPRIKITFVDKDAQLAKKIMEVLDSGSLVWSKNKNYVDLLVQDVKTLHFIASLINGKMRTPKIEALHRLIDWLNKRKDFNNITKLELDSTPLESNAWLSGLLEADSNFYSQFTVNSKGIVNSIRFYMRISQRKYYHRKNNDNHNTDSYLSIMSNIKNTLKVNSLIEIKRVRQDYIEESFEIRTVKKESCTILIDYLSKYPLFSSKHLDYLNWCKIHEIHKFKKYKNIENSNLLFYLKNSMNSLRTEFDWRHLLNFYSK